MTDKPDYKHGQPKPDFVPPEPFSPSTSKNVTLEMFSPERVRLMREVNRHPELVVILHELPTDADWGEQLAEIAAWVMVGMEGEYLPHELDEIYTDILLRLCNRRRD